MLNLERLRVLEAVARHGSVGAAAQELHVTPSAVSQQLSKLEREVGRPLVQRVGRGIRLTAVAELLVERAGPILSLVVQAESDLQEHHGEVAGSLVVAAFATAIRGLLADVLADLRTRYPELSVRVGETEPPQALAGLVCGDVDLAVVQEWPNARLPRDARLRFSSLCQDPVELALPADHPLADSEAIELATLADAAWIAPPPGTVCHDWQVQTLRGCGIEPRVEHTATEYATHAALTATGNGLALIPRLGRMPHPGVRYLPVRPALHRNILIVTRTDTTNRPNVRAVEEAARRRRSDDAPTGAMKRCPAGGPQHPGPDDRPAGAGPGPMIASEVS